MTKKELAQLKKPVKGLVWMPFPTGWPAAFRSVSSKEFEYYAVNGKCAWVAHMLHKFLGAGIEQYGFFSGQVTDPFWKWKPFIRHGWLKLGANILDPTRFCFTSHMPKLAVCPATSPDYDQGMNRMRAQNRRPMPDFSGKPVECQQVSIQNLFGGLVCDERLFWLANLPPLDPIFSSQYERKKMFRWLESSGRREWIPIDNRV
jgi:hypothetical protein